MFVSAALLSEERTIRLDAARTVELDADGIYALRNVLVADDDGEVRGAAAERLGLAQVARAPGYMGVKSALLDALDDASPYVREHAALSLSRHLEGSEGLSIAKLVEQRLAEMLCREPMWRVRRAGVRALAAIAQERAIALLGDVLDDPFWRVRYAAIQALAAWPSCESSIDQPGSARRRAAIAFLRSIWRGERAVDLTPTEPERVGGVDASGLGDEDPAVVAVRLARLPDAQLRAEEVVPLLASPHEVLRRLAIKRIAERGSDDEMLAALALLDEPRVPYIDESVRRVLARADARRLRGIVLERGDSSPAALAWAFEQAATTSDDVVEDASRHLAHAHVRVRRAAARSASLAATDALIHAVQGDADDVVRATCIEWLASRLDEPKAVAALDALDPSSEPPRIARALALVCAQRDTPSELAHRIATRASDAQDASTRSAAIAWLMSAKQVRAPSSDRAEALSDPDPWMRLAGLDVDCAANALEKDADPTVRRRAFELLTHAPVRRVDAMVLAARSDDGWVRARAATALVRADGGASGVVEMLLLLTRDRTLMVRSAAAEALAKCANVASACFDLVAREPPIDEELRLAAHGQLVREGTPRAFAALEHDLAVRSLSTTARWTLRGMSLAYPPDSRAGTELTFEPREPVVAAARRPHPGIATTLRDLGRTGIRVAPLGISGAFELPVSCLERARDAGVNAFFWEPEYRTMSEFLARAERKDELVVICGSYEADAKTITRDVERALKRLRRESLGVMLLFWVRSRARLDDASFECLDRLKQQGKVRAIGLSTHLRDLATEAITLRPWDVVMCRHSAAHTGLETSVLPVARERGVGVIAFSALVYGRMLRDGGARVDAADCYRYCLTQEGVSLCLSAPRRQRELEENLGVLRTPTLDPETVTRMRQHGVRVRADDRAFMSLVRDR